MSSNQVPLWVPVVVALLGFVGVLGAQFIAAWREDRRWRRELEREELRWQRERVRARDDRSYDGRQQAYAEIITAVEAFDWLAYPFFAMGRRQEDIPDEMLADLRQAREEARQAFGLVNLHAPDEIRVLLRQTMLPRSNLALRLIDGKYTVEELEQLWSTGQQAYQAMRAAMRKDLVLGSGVRPDEENTATDAPLPPTGQGPARTADPSSAVDRDAGNLAP